MKITMRGQTRARNPTCLSSRQKQTLQDWASTCRRSEKTSTGHRGNPKSKFENGLLLMKKIYSAKGFAIVLCSLGVSLVVVSTVYQDVPCDQPLSMFLTISGAFLIFMGTNTFLATYGFHFPSSFLFLESLSSFMATFGSAFLLATFLNVCWLVPGTFMYEFLFFFLEDAHQQQ